MVSVSGPTPHGPSHASVANTPAGLDPISELLQIGRRPATTPHPDDIAGPADPTPSGDSDRLDDSDASDTEEREALRATVAAKLAAARRRSQVGPTPSLPLPPPGAVSGTAGSGQPVARPPSKPTMLRAVVDEEISLKPSPAVAPSSSANVGRARPVAVAASSEDDSDEDHGAQPIRRAPVPPPKPAPKPPAPQADVPVITAGDRVAQAMAALTRMTVPTVSSSPPASSKDVAIVRRPMALTSMTEPLGDADLAAVAALAPSALLDALGDRPGSRSPDDFDDQRPTGARPPVAQAKAPPRRPNLRPRVDLD
jgi:hypothetical protein